MSFLLIWSFGSTLPGLKGIRPAAANPPKVMEVQRSPFHCWSGAVLSSSTYWSAAWSLLVKSSFGRLFKARTTRGPLLFLRSCEKQSPVGPEPMRSIVDPALGLVGSIPCIIQEVALKTAASSHKRFSNWKSFSAEEMQYSSNPPSALKFSSFVNIMLCFFPYSGFTHGVNGGP